MTNSSINGTAQTGLGKNNKYFYKENVSTNEAPEIPLFKNGNILKRKAGRTNINITLLWIEIMRNDFIR